MCSHRHNLELPLWYNNQEYTHKFAFGEHLCLGYLESWDVPHQSTDHAWADKGRERHEVARRRLLVPWVGRNWLLWNHQDWCGRRSEGIIHAEERRWSLQWHEEASFQVHWWDLRLWEDELPFHGRGERTQSDQRGQYPWYLLLISYYGWSEGQVVGRKGLW